MIVSRCVRYQPSLSRSLSVSSRSLQPSSFIKPAIAAQQPRRLASSSANKDNNNYNNMAPTDYTKLPTPSHCYVDFCLVPIGTGTPSVAKEVADIQKLLKASGLYYKLHSAGTTVEGSWDEVMKVIGQAHTLVHQSGAIRIQTALRAGSRTDKDQTADQKIKRVEDILASEGDA